MRVLGIAMATLGFIWAMVGAADTVLQIFASNPMETQPGFGFLPNMVIFILPGLVVAAVGLKLRPQTA